MSHALVVAHPREQSPPHNSIKELSYRYKVMWCPARPLAKWLYEAQSDKICRWHKSTMRASWRLYLSIAHLVKANK